MFNLHRLRGLVFAAFTLSVVGMPANAQVAAQAIKPGKAYLRVLSYNVKGLPSIINSYPKSRFSVIGKLLKERRRNGTAPDIVLLQESFINPTLAIQTESGYPFIANGPPKTGKDADGHSYKKLLNSGIYIMSEYPILKLARMTYPRSMCRMADCFANKGAQIVKVRVPQIPFDVWVSNTHAQAENSFDSTRIKQFPLLVDFVEHYADRGADYGALIFGGDFNTSPVRKSYFVLSDLIDAANVGETCLNPKSGCEVSDRTPTDWILQKSQDHIFYSGGRKVRVRPVEFDRGFQERHKGKQLSDHLGYEVLFEISWS